MPISLIVLEEARYCDFEKLKTAANPEEELVKINLMVEGT